MAGYRIARVRVVFALPPAIISQIFTADAQKNIPPYLAYVDWYTPFNAHPERHHLMYKISPCSLPEGGCLASIIPVSRIHRSIKLFPKFGPAVPEEWTSDTVLDLCKTFFVNPFTDRHFYRIFY